MTGLKRLSNWDEGEGKEWDEIEGTTVTRKGLSKEKGERGEDGAGERERSKESSGANGFLGSGRLMRRRGCSLVEPNSFL